MFKKNQVILTTITLLFFAVFFFTGCKEEQKPLAGYINNTWFEFPKDKYTFAISVRQHDDGKQYIDDVVWGYKYPSMQPLLQDSKMRGHFIGDWIDTNWIRVGVEHDSTKGQSDWFEKIIKVINISNPSLTGLVKGGHYVVESTPNNISLYHAYLDEEAKSKYPDGLSTLVYGQNIYWYKPKDKILAIIYCANHKNHSGAHCIHKISDPLTGVIVSMDYDSKYLDDWQNIEMKTLDILHSFVKK